MFSQKAMPTVLFIMALLPIIYIAAPLFHMFSGMSWSQVVSTLTDSEVDQAMATSALSAIVTTGYALLFGLPTAFFLSLNNFWGKRLVEGVLLLPLVMPPVVGGMAQLFLYGPLTSIGAWFGGHNIALTNSLIGVILAQSYITSPFMIFAAKAGFEEIPRELIEATQTLGGGIWHVFWHVSLPLSRAAILSGIALTFARAIGEFGGTMIMAYHPYTLPVEIWVQFTSGGFDTIVPIAFVLTVFALLVALVGPLRLGSRGGGR